MKKHFIGIDISKRTLDVCVYSPLINPENYTQVTNDSLGFKTLLKWFKSKSFSFSDIVICMEHTGIYGLDISLFFEANSLDYCMISGYEMKHSVGFARGKSDKVDSFRIAHYCYLYREELKYSRVKSKVLLSLRDLMSERRSCVKRASQCKAYLTEHKKNTDSSGYSRYSRELKYLNTFIHEIEKELILIIESDSDLYNTYKLITSIVGIALINAVNVLLYTNNFEAFDNAREYACYCGIAPFSKQSGTSINSPAKTDSMCNKTLKSELTQASLSAIVHDSELRMYYQRKLMSGKHPGVILNAVKFKLLERIFAVVKRGTPYVKLSTYSS
ncbi:IS110 family transposase [Dysgonomonas sp. GY617]|uniref:IS110 family transposase n=1 Tax=Dysgonomonas sp. GY617 TaxID=2780420 RepID=UPI0018845F28|nr:transposase [Dysgonomonas sp. GY617]MBF0574416.1 transposase [Dysgonomonas sp. GY617]